MDRKLLNAIGLLLGMVLALALLGGIGYGGVAAFKYVGARYSSLDQQTAKLAAIASMVAVFCALIVASALKSGVKSAASAEKAELYARLLSFCCEKSLDQEKLAEIEKLLALLGSKKVIDSYMTLRQGNEEFHELLSKLAMEMRADLGHSVTSTEEKNLRALLAGLN